MNKVLITGFKGFLGSYLQEYLKPFYKIDTLSVRYQLEQQFEILSEVIIHLAGKAHDLKKVSHPQEYYEANFELTKQLFDAFLESEAKVFVFMSSVKAVADKIDGVLTEDTMPDPKTHYGISKQQAEHYILNQKVPEGKRVYILRPCMVHGPGNKGNLNVLYKMVSKGIPWPLGAFENERSFLSIENLCFVIQELLQKEEIPSGVYHIADDEVVSTNELIEILAESLNKKANIWKINPKLIEKTASVGDRLRLPLNTERLQKLTESYVVSNQKILAAIGKPLPVKAREGLLKTFTSFKG